MLMTPAGAALGRTEALAVARRPFPSEKTGRAQRRVDGVMRLERATGGGTDESERKRR